MDFLLRQPGDTANPLLPRLCGKGATRGIPYLKGMEGARVKFILFLAAGGRYGCDGIDSAHYKGNLLNEYDGSVGVWKFHPGTRSTGYGDPVQGRPEFWPELDMVFSGMSYLEGLMPEDLSEDFDPNGFEIFMRGLRLMHYTADSNGNLVEDAPAFSASNALAALDTWLDVGKLPLSRFSPWGESWVEFHETCIETLAWDKTGTGTILNVPRYDCHVPFTSQLDPSTAFEAIMLRAPGASWQDVNGGIRILPSPDRAPVHRFSFDPTQSSVLSNIVKGSFSGNPGSVEELPNYFIFPYRDLEDPFYKLKYVIEDREELRDQAGGILNVLESPSLGLMYESLAQRIAKTTVRLLVDSPYTTRFNLLGQMDSYHVAKGDNVELTHDQIAIRETSPLLARVTRETFEPKRGERTFGLRLTTTDYYRDSDHGKKQN